MESENIESKHFAYVIDGEVAWIQSLHPAFMPKYDQIVAVFSSNPQLIEVDGFVEIGYTYDGVSGEFLAPQIEE